MRNLYTIVFILSLSAFPAQTATGDPAAALDQRIIDQLPSGEEWLVHFTRDILPYWSSEDALGEPIGRFPTFRYADGEPIDVGELLRPELKGLHEDASWITGRLDRTYTRMVSRQAYVLGVAFHLTGDGRYLDWAREAVDHMVKDLLDESGSFCSWIERGTCRPEAPRRTAQDLAYAFLGPAFYVYLTHDTEVLDALVTAQRRFFEAYRDPETGLLSWVLEAWEDPPDLHSPDQMEIVAQLDQINAYLLLLDPLIPASDAARWRADLLGLARVLMDRFYSAEHNIFWGRIDKPKYRQFGGHHHTDAGHTAKTFWMLSRIAYLTGDEAMADFAEKNGQRLLETLFLADSGSWSDGWKEDGSLKGTTLWWAFAEIDQLAANLALRDLKAGRHLPQTYDFWFIYFVDHRHSGIWPFAIDPQEQIPALKAHLWKNGYHSSEHALVGYITGNALRGESVDLYFASKIGAKPGLLKPYVFGGRGEIVRRLPLAKFPHHERLQVRFRDVR